MTGHEQKMFNEHATTVQAYKWRDRTVARLLRKLEPLGPSDKIQLLRQIDELLG